MSEPNYCPECRIGDGSHQWSCQSVPEDRKAAHFERWAQTFLNGQERYRQALQGQHGFLTALQGKVAVLRHENNKLRAKRARLRRLLEMAEGAGYAKREWIEAEEKWKGYDEHPYFRREADTEKAYYEEMRAMAFAAAGIPETEDCLPVVENSGG